jgi:hypothetical protein
MFADDEKDEMEQPEPEQEEPEKESFDAEMTLLDSTPPVEEAPAEKKKPPAPKKKEPAATKAKEPAASKAKEPPAPKEKEDDAWQTVASTPSKKAEEPKAEKKEKPSAPSKAEFAPTRPLDTVNAAEEGESGGSKVPLGDFMDNLGIKDQTLQIVVLVVVGLVLLCCVCSCLGIAASMMFSGGGSFSY